MGRPRLTVVGLGPGDPDLLSRGAWRAIQDAGALLVRTRIHPTVSFLEAQGITVDSCDDVYGSEDSFEQVYTRVVDRVVQRVRRDGALVFGVPGHPLMGERAVVHLREIAPREGIDLVLHTSPGFLDVVLPAVGLDPGEGLIVLDALAPSVPPAGVPAVYFQVHSRLVASELKLALLESLSPETPVWHVRAAGCTDEAVASVPLYRLDRLDCDHLTTVVVPGSCDERHPGEPAGANAGGDPGRGHGDLRLGERFEELVRLMETLRGPGGCPWDQEQTFRSLRRYVLEEAYEVVDCIDQDRIDLLPDELGDLLLQVIFHAQMGRDEGRFDIGNVIETLSQKLIRRHPHVFGDIQVNNAGEVVQNWEAIKKEERAGESASDSPTSLLDAVPPALPSMTRADKLFRKAARVGFDWPDAGGALDKVLEEVAEVREAAGAGRPENIRAEVGDLFLAAINAARKLDLDPEEVTREALARFVHRFQTMEKLARRSGRSLPAMTLGEMDALWEEAKRQIGAP